VHALINPLLLTSQSLHPCTCMSVCPSVFIRIPSPARYTCTRARSTLHSTSMFFGRVRVHARVHTSAQLQLNSMISCVRVQHDKESHRPAFIVIVPSGPSNSSYRTNTNTIRLSQMAQSKASAAGLSGCACVPRMRSGKKWEVRGTRGSARRLNE
jgi:hypothetical protein